MTWLTLFNKLGKQPIKITNKNQVKVVINSEEILLDLRFETDNTPYFIVETQALNINKIKEKQHDFISTQESLKDVTPFITKDGEKQF